MILAARMGESGAIPLQPINGSGAPLTMNFIIQPGIKTYGNTYDCNADGLYVFTNSSTGDVSKRIVWSGDVDALMSALCYSIVHGPAHEGLSLTDKTRQARLGWVIVRCGHAVSWVQSILQSLGIQSRQVHFLTMDTPTNYDDGHRALEVRINGNWVLYDVSLDRRFVDLNGTPLTAGQVPDAISQGTGSPYHITASKISYAPAFYDPNAAWAQITFDRADGQMIWTRRIFQAVGIDHSPGNVYFKLPAGCEDRKVWVESRSSSYHVVDDHTAWASLYY